MNNLKTDTIRGYTLLLVDDDDINLDIMYEYLAPYGYHIIQVHDGAEAWEVLQKHHPIDTILLDRMMPNMNGIELLEKMKLHEDLRDIPVIMQTGATSSKDILEGIKAGVFYYLTKPYNKTILINLVHAALNKHKYKPTLKPEPKMFDMIRLMDRGVFHFQTLKDADCLCTHIAKLLPDPYKAMSGLHEVTYNAIEHGNLGISYEKKSELVLQGKWQQEVEQRLCEPSYHHKKATLTFENTPEAYSMTIEDEGNGFDHERFMNIDPKRIEHPNGRGIAIANLMSFDKMEYQDNGHIVKCWIYK